MLHYLLLAYVVIYCCFGLFLFVAYARVVPKEDKEEDKRWETPLDLVLVVVGLAGMIFLVAGVDSNVLKVIWRPVSVALVTTQVVINVKGRRDMIRSGEAKPDDAEVCYADISTILFLLPSTVLNLCYAFG